MKKKMGKLTYGYIPEKPLKIRFFAFFFLKKSSTFLSLTERKCNC